MKLTITGDAYALTSAIKVADIELLGKYNPDALTGRKESRVRSIVQRRQAQRGKFRRNVWRQDPR